MIVISDTTPIISLLKANHLELLEKLYGNVLIPEAVYQELTSNPAYEKEGNRNMDYKISGFTASSRTKSCQPPMWLFCGEKWCTFIKCSHRYG